MNIKINELLSTKERIKILEKVLLEDDIRVSKTAKELSLSKGLISKYFDILINNKVMKRKENTLVISNNSETKALKIMLTILKIPQIFSKHKFVKAAGLYGSAARGTNTKDSDIDLWIKVDSLTNTNVPKLNSELVNKLENVKILFLDNLKIAELKKSDLMFYHSLYFGSVIIYGGENEI